MMDQNISAFIGEQKVATVACIDGQAPYCFNCYYAFLEQDGLLIYKSSFNSKHEKILQQNKQVAGTIIPEQIDLATLRGIQFEGNMLEDDFQLNLKISAAYYLRFPFAMSVPGKLYAVQLENVKFTDNSKGFGFKQHWSRQVPS